MSNFKGFATLACPADLLVKLQHDLSRMEQYPENPYPAFDFFVTAEHLFDWLYPDSEASANVRTRKQRRETEPLLRITSHLANGAKHFEAMAPHHKSVDDIQVRSLFNRAMFNPRLFNTKHQLAIKLQEVDAAALGLQVVSAIDLASRVLAYWQQHLSSSAASSGNKSEEDNK